MDGQQVSSFSRKGARSVERRDAPVTTELDYLLNNFRDEYIRLMKMQNYEFELDKKEFLQKIYKIG